VDSNLNKKGENVIGLGHISIDLRIKLISSVFLCIGWNTRLTCNYFKTCVIYVSCLTILFSRYKPNIDLCHNPN
jgi:hypothetical protein